MDGRARRMYKRLIARKIVLMAGWIARRIDGWLHDGYQDKEVADWMTRSMDDWWDERMNEWLD